MSLTITRRVPTPIMHRVVEHAGVLHLGGVVADDWTLDAAGQMTQIAEKIDALLESHGSTSRNLLSATIFVADFADKPAIDAVWKQWLEADHLPARATLAVADLGDDVLVEIVCTAAVNAA
ncbi:RidA family protein [Microbacterium capsulatum]|uniref:RidA family protein n=1 Tax=Microbacterium capsulatum TaxID=3041921 RepID=A0ABU0XBQ9_9MICO|nr:RidA family protein [Microbacterium sp. ASV81]MDQ4212549.1 RidA family protein [Microbacterium sp. ASV81]